MNHFYSDSCVVAVAVNKNPHLTMLKYLMRLPKVLTRNVLNESNGRAQVLSIVAAVAAVEAENLPQFSAEAAAAAAAAAADLHSLKLQQRHQTPASTNR